MVRWRRRNGPWESITVWLAAAGFDQRQALALAVDLEYSHPDFVQAALGGGTLSAGPWLQSLNDGWKRVRAVWQAPLRKALCGLSRAHPEDA